MKTIEVFLDESGDMQRGMPMNVSGLVVISPSEEERDYFHNQVYNQLKEKDRLAGVCDLGGSHWNAVSLPERFLHKRVAPEDLYAHWANILGAASEVANVAASNNVEIGASSLKFPTSSAKPWSASNLVQDVLLDRPYSERVKDVLELLFFETPWLQAHLSAEDGCLVSVNLPTRAVATDASGLDAQAELLALRCNWGILENDAWESWDRQTNAPQLSANILSPSDGIDILSALVSRRHPALGHRVKFERCCCCKLVAWDDWSYWNDNKRLNHFRYQVLPRQLHYLADYLANGVFWNSTAVWQNPFNEWFKRGFRLDAQGPTTDAWILSKRLFANGDHVGAISHLDKKCAASDLTASPRFFRRGSKDWSTKLTGDDLRALFRRVTCDEAVEHPPDDTLAAASTEAPKAESLDEPVSASIMNEEAPSETGEGRQDSAAAELMTFPQREIQWRLLIVLPGTFNHNALKQRVAEIYGNEVVDVRLFPSEQKTEIIVDVVSQKTVCAAQGTPVEIGGCTVIPTDVTLPRVHRLAQKPSTDQS